MQKFDQMNIIVLILQFKKLKYFLILINIIRKILHESSGHFPNEMTIVYKWRKIANL